MNQLLIKTIMFLGLNKAILKASFIFAFTGAVAEYFLGLNLPSEILGTTIFLWLLYIFTITLDWISGLRASKYESRIKGEVFIYDKDKANVNWYKHALFIIVIATIYHFRLEAETKKTSEWIVNTLVTVKYTYFGYNMITEWVSIENNRFRVTGKKTRLYGLLIMVLDTLDKSAAKKLRNITNLDKDDN